MTRCCFCKRLRGDDLPPEVPIVVLILNDNASPAICAECVDVCVENIKDAKRRARASEGVYTNVYKGEP